MSSSKAASLTPTPRLYDGLGDPDPAVTGAYRRSPHWEEIDPEVNRNTLRPGSYFVVTENNCFTCGAVNETGLAFEVLTEAFAAPEGVHKRMPRQSWTYCPSCDSNIKRFPLADPTLLSFYTYLQTKQKVVALYQTLATENRG